MPIVYRGAKEICAAIGEDYRQITVLVKEEGLPAWRRNGSGVWRALPEDLERWIVEQRGKYLSSSTL